jgi:hypothetical protein
MRSGVWLGAAMSTPRDAAFEAWTARARSVPIENEIYRRGIPLRGTVEREGPCPKCGGTDRFAINIEKQVWNCRGCDKGGDVIGLVEHLDGCDFIDACATLNGEPPPKPNGKNQLKQIVAATFPYEDQNGTLAFEVVRFEFQQADGSFVLKDGKREKTFRQRRPDPERAGEWIWNVEGAPVLPYRLPELIETVASERMIVIAEGEAKVDLLRSWNVPATCCAGGAKKWRPDHAAFLRGADGVVLPDNDQAGRKHLDVVATSLQGIATSVRVLELLGLPPKGDIKDWAATGGTVEQLHDLIAREAKPWTPIDHDEAKHDTLVLDPHDPMPSARELVANNFITDELRTLHRHRGAFWVWGGSYYLLADDEMIEAKIWTLLEKAKRLVEKGPPVPFKPNCSRVSNVAAALGAVCQLDKHIEPPAWLTKQQTAPPAGELLACGNGLLHLPTGKLYAPSPAYFNLNASGVEFDPSAPEPTQWLAFLGQLFDNDQQAIELLQDYFGYLLPPIHHSKKSFSPSARSEAARGLSPASSRSCLVVLPSPVRRFLA